MEEKIRALKESMNTYENLGDTTKSTNAIKFFGVILKDSSKDNNKFYYDFSISDLWGHKMLYDYYQNEFKDEEDLTEDEKENIRDFNDGSKNDKEISSMYKNVQFAEIDISLDDIEGNDRDENSEEINGYRKIVKILSAYEFSFGNGIWTGYLMLVQDKNNDKFITGEVVDSEYEEGNHYFGRANNITKKDFDKNILWLIQHYLYYGINNY